MLIVQCKTFHLLYVMCTADVEVFFSFLSFLSLFAA